MSQQFVTVETVARELRVTMRQVRRWAEDGLIPFSYLEDDGRMVFVLDEVLDRIHAVSGYSRHGVPKVELVGVLEAAKYTPYSVEKLRELAAAGRVPCFEYAGRFLFNPQVLKATVWVESLEKMPGAKLATRRRKLSLPSIREPESPQ